VLQLQFRATQNTDIGVIYDITLNTPTKIKEQGCIFCQRWLHKSKGLSNKGDQLSRTFSQESQVFNTNEDKTRSRQQDKNDEQSVFLVNILQFSYIG
jgi:hypothetical protein